TGITAGNDMRFKADKLEASRNFANKLWNASRFVIMNLQDENGEFRVMADDTQGIDQLALKDEDKWIIAKVNDAIKEATSNMDRFELSLAAQKTYELIWNEYCDWYIELVKGRLYGDDEEDKKVARYVLVRALKDMLKLLHPFMPFITEEIWSFLPKNKTTVDNSEGFLIKESWPVFDSALTFEAEVKKLELAMETIRSIRNIRAEAEAAPSRKLSAVILSSSRDLENIKGGERYIKSLANITEISFITDKSLVPEEVMSAVVDNIEIYIPLDDLLDYKAEFDRLQKEKTRLTVEVERVKGKLANEGFVSKAPEKVINEEREKMAKFEDMLVKVSARLALVEKKL
ncbi:MAG TPA: class I tRNA ligase family protein, partial [Anaerovoracaceae bacterium]|nr:class I tRNA ligase family protein [Anaerovoracaceae bacterium]